MVAVRNASRHNARRVRKLLEPVGTETDWGRAPEASRAERGESFFLLVFPVEA